MRKNLFFIIVLLVSKFSLSSQQVEMKTPPMGFMTWNYFGLNISEQDIITLTDAMVETGLRDLGYEYIFIDDGWQGGRDAKNNIVPDPKKFPSGLKYLVDYVHSKGMKIGIYSDAAPLTCGGYTASLGFEEQDARSFAAWGFDYLKYDYCGAPADWITAATRYYKMRKALDQSGKQIALGICEWGDREPWLWAKKAGGQLWRTSADIRDKWTCGRTFKDQSELHGYGAGILDILEVNSKLARYSGPDGWNDPDMLVVGLYGKESAPSSDLGGSGCTDIEYQSQMSLWCLMASPLMITCDVRSMNEATRKILTDKDVIAIDQDILGIQAERKVKTETYQIFVKPLANGDVAIGMLNTSDKKQKVAVSLKELGVYNKSKAMDLWSKKGVQISRNRMVLDVESHETRLLRLSDN